MFRAAGPFRPRVEPLRILIASTPVVAPLGSGGGGGVELTLRNLVHGLHRFGRRVCPRASSDDRKVLAQPPGAILAVSLKRMTMPGSANPGGRLRETNRGPPSVRIDSFHAMRLPRSGNVTQRHASLLARLASASETHGNLHPIANTRLCADIDMSPPVFLIPSIPH